jgi:hypothetical protein
MQQYIKMRLTPFSPPPQIIIISIKEHIHIKRGRMSPHHYRLCKRGTKKKLDYPSSRQTLIIMYCLERERKNELFFSAFDKFSITIQ